MYKVSIRKTTTQEDRMDAEQLEGYVETIMAITEYGSDAAENRRAVHEVLQDMIDNETRRDNSILLVRYDYDKNDDAFRPEV